MCGGYRALSLIDSFACQNIGNIISVRSVPMGTSQGHEEFALPGRFPASNCNGRLCAKCGRCRDWCYTGDVASWQWIRNVANWNNEDWSRWGYGAYWKNFKIRHGASCNHHHGLIDRAIDFGYHPFAPANGGPAFFKRQPIKSILFRLIIK
ncbi:hypothetical protein I4U23_016916 [Adineta vaga]|nr:hypothetical protein I4U23_016916 [Adineta vaga]